MTQPHRTETNRRPVEHRDVLGDRAHLGTTAADNAGALEPLLADDFSLTTMTCDQQPKNAWRFPMPTDGTAADVSTRVVADDTIHGAQADWRSQFGRDGQQAATRTAQHPVTTPW